MRNKRREPTFSEIVDEERAKPDPRLRNVRPGHFNHDGEFFDPEGNLVMPVKSEITPNQARHHVEDGALVAFEGCGCGGMNGCSPSWFRPDELPSGVRPRFVKGYGSPTWIDLWEGEASTVVFLHGDVEWGDVLDTA